MKPKTVGAVFLKSKVNTLRELHKSIVELTNTPASQEQEVFVDSAISMTGAFDFLLMLRGADAEAISNFVLTHLREHSGHLVADTQTFIGWLISEKS